MGHFTDLKQKTVLVTGAASGIGQAQMLAFLAEGATVIALDKAPITKVADGLKSRCSRRYPINGDVTKLVSDRALI